MRYLSFIIVLFIIIPIQAQSPHGSSFEMDCSQCHSADSWNVNLSDVTFNHSKTAFPLQGQHKLVDCTLCHESLEFKKVESSCSSCHTDLHQGTVGFNCERCHTPETWIVTDINSLHRESRFPLIGSHITADCIQCHSGYTNLNFEPLGINCFDCHSSDYYTANSPNHVAAGFSTDCQSCHQITSRVWASNNFDHSFFPLTGGHRKANCFDCHTQGNNFNAISADCYSCHKIDFETAKDPNHLSASFPHDCSLCHTITVWDDADFNHNLTAFPLTGAHTSATCESCHQTGYTGTSHECFSCHQNVYNNSVNPNHQAAGISTECQSCHNTTAFIPSSFNHAATGFTLQGKHLSTECSSCHTGSTSGASQACISCHQQDYNNAENHISQSYPHDCSLCHGFNSWDDADFNHNLTAFPLTGAHISATCESCHQTSYTGTSTNCYDCHTANYTSSSNPSHTALAISTDCQTCHSTNNDWMPALFPDHNSYYQLIGAHSQIVNECVSCHNGNYNSTPDNCVGCHQADYNNTTNPNHQTSGFNTDCETCHTQNAWTPAAFDHDQQFFPIYSGNHREEWNSCSDCHINAANFSVFSCTDCHEHDKAETDDDHNEVNGYVYESTQCLSCHPNGEDINIRKSNIRLR